MDPVTVSLAEWLGRFRVCFARPESFAVFEPVVASRIPCPRRRTLTEVWRLTGLGPEMHFDATYSLFSSAQWEWDELGVLLCLLILSHLPPSGLVSLVVDDTLCRKRGKRVAFGGIFLDLGALRLWLWKKRHCGEAGEGAADLEMVESLLNEMAAV